METNLMQNHPPNYQVDSYPTKKTADFMAKRGAFLEAANGLEILQSPPNELCNILNLDLRGITTPRIVVTDYVHFGGLNEIFLFTKKKKRVGLLSKGIKKKNWLYGHGHYCSL